SRWRRWRAARHEAQPPATKRPRACGPPSAAPRRTAIPSALAGAPTTGHLRRNDRCVVTDSPGPNGPTLCPSVRIGREEPPQLSDLITQSIVTALAPIRHPLEPPLERL